MANLFLYQLIDSSSVKNGSEKSEQLEKADERISHLKAEKNSIPKKEEDSTNSITDTFYGIKNEGTIPTRKIKIITTQTPQEDVLFNPIPLKTQISNWQIITLLFTIVFFGASKAFSSNRFKQTLKALIKYSVAQEINREEKVFFHRANVFFTLIHLLTTSLFIFHIIEMSIDKILEGSDFAFFLLTIGGVMLAYSIKYLVSRILFYILDDTSISSEYIFNVSLYNNLFGVLLIPVLVVAYFSPIEFDVIFIYVALPLILLIFFLRLVRLFVIGKTKEISYFYIFLYICTLEILPLVVLYRIFIFK